jgi:hypothetical protein
MDWPEEPATEQQLMRLQSFGYVVAQPLTVIEAARLIREYQRHPSRRAYFLSGTGSKPEPPTLRMPKADLEQRSGCSLFPDQAEPAPVENVRVYASVAAREDFWSDTCREIREMHLRSVEVIEFNQKHGCRFVPPTHEQVRYVLNALDTAVPDWEDGHPELFYQTLELNFPELLRHM